MTLALLEVAAQASLTFLTLGAMFCPLERAFPACPGQPVLRPRVGLDLTFFLTQQLCTGYVILAVLAWLHAHAALLPLAALRHAFSLQPAALRLVEVVMLGDLFAYWGHPFSIASSRYGGCTPCITAPSTWIGSPRIGSIRWTGCTPSSYSTCP